MKYRFAIIVALLFPIVVIAQTDKANDNKIKPPSLIGGIQADFHIAYEFLRLDDKRIAVICGGGVVFARKYIGKHFALELEAARSISEKTFSSYSFWGYDEQFSYRANELDIPLHFQYHFGKREYNLRPYMGIGLGYFSHSATYGSRDLVTRQEHLSIIKVHGPMFQFTEGISYTVNKRLQVNQSLYYKWTLTNGNNSIGIRFGLGYIIM